MPLIFQQKCTRRRQNARPEHSSIPQWLSLRQANYCFKSSKQTPLARTSVLPNSTSSIILNARHVKVISDLQTKTLLNRLKGAESSKNVCPNHTIFTRKSAAKLNEIRSDRNAITNTGKTQSDTRQLQRERESYYSYLTKRPPLKCNVLAISASHKEFYDRQQKVISDLQINKLISFLKSAESPNVLNHSNHSRTSATKLNETNLNIPVPPDRHDISYKEVVNVASRVNEKQNLNGSSNSKIKSIEQKSNEKKPPDAIRRTLDANISGNLFRPSVGQTLFEIKCELKDRANTKVEITNSLITLEGGSQNFKVNQSLCMEKNLLTLGVSDNIELNEAKTKANIAEPHECTSQIKNFRFSIPGENIEKSNLDSKTTIVTDSFLALNFELKFYSYVRMPDRHYESKHLNLCNGSFKISKKLDNDWAYSLQDLLEHFTEHSILSRIAHNFNGNLLNHREIMVYVVMSHISKLSNHELSVSNISHCSQYQPKIDIQEAFLKNQIPFANEVHEAYEEISGGTLNEQFHKNKFEAQTQSFGGNNSDLRPQQSSSPPEATPGLVPHHVPYQEVVPQPVAQKNQITMNSQFDHLKVQSQIFEITRKSKYSNFYSFSLLNNSHNECVISFASTFNFVFLALSRFYFDSKIFLIKCSGCDFEADPKQIFHRSENSSLSRKIRKKWCFALYKLCYFKMHGPNCFWTQHLQNALYSSSGADSDRGQNSSAEVNARIDFCSNLVLSLRDPEDLTSSERPCELELALRSEYTSDLLFINELMIYLLRLKFNPWFLQNPEIIIFFLTHEQIPNIKFLYFMPQPSHVPNRKRRPLTMSEAKSIIRVVDFKRDNPSDAKQKEAAEHRSTWARWQSFLRIEAFKQKTDALRLAFYLSLCGIFVSSIEDSGQKARATRGAKEKEGRLVSKALEVRLTCTFCLQSHTLRISLENDVEYVYLQIKRKHDLRSPTCPRTLGSSADDEPFKASQKNEILAKIINSSIQNISSCLILPGMFRKLYSNDNKAIIAKSTLNQPRKPDVIKETIELLIELTPQNYHMEVTTALDEDCSELNIDFWPLNRPEVVSEPDNLSFLDINCTLYDKEDSQITPELDEETISNKEHSDLLTVLLGNKQPNVKYVNAVQREESFYKMCTASNAGESRLICIWPHSAIQELKPFQMSAAGFYLALDEQHIQQIDRVQCYMCGVVLAEWTASDRPMEKHMQIAPECPFVLRLYGREHLFNSKINSETFNNCPPVLKRGTFPQV